MASRKRSGCLGAIAYRMRLGADQPVGSQSRQGINVTITDIHTVLLVENEPLIALDLEGMLLEAGVGRVHHTMSVGAALDWLAGNAPALAILDVVVEGGSSASVADRLRQRAIPFLIYSGHARHGELHGAGLSGAVWLAKPCTQVDLVAAIETALRRPL